ncbi:hypothetical protein ACPSYO_03560 [Yersinia pseudotuberculosis]|uniref:hypothetical protein n=1 Tax=Yersinia pseudotuberculosis TaxID=633 RepID=UPI00402B7028
MKVRGYGGISREGGPLANKRYQGDSRYSQKYLDENNADVIFMADGSKREMHKWQHDKILEYKANNGGRRPPLNKSVIKLLNYEIMGIVRG